MKLTEKDIAFLDTLRALTQETDLWVERRGHRLILRKNYGEQIERRFKMTRQGIRWRFQRVADMYLSSFQTILKIEQTFGTDIRPIAIEASKHQAKLHSSHNGDDQSSGGDPDD